MIHTLLKAGAVLALGSFAFATPALALPPLLSGGAAPLVILAQDEENKELWQDLRPDVTPPPAAVGKEGEAPEGAMGEEPEEEGSGGTEEKALKEDGLEGD